MWVSIPLLVWICPQVPELMRSLRHVTFHLWKNKPRRARPPHWHSRPRGGGAAPQTHLQDPDESVNYDLRRPGEESLWGPSQHSVQDPSLFSSAFRGLVRTWKAHCCVCVNLGQAGSEQRVKVRDAFDTLES